MITKVSPPIPAPGLTELTLLTHVHTVTIVNEQTGLTYEEICQPAEPLEGETLVTVAKHRHKTSDGYTGTSL